MTEQATSEPLALLINTTCRHIGTVGNTASAHLLESRKVQLAFLGHVGWAVEVREATNDELLGVMAGRRCPTCRLD